jgi:hypothetical protein
MALRPHLAAILGYLVLALWLTWPTAAHLRDAYFTSGNNIFFFPATPDAPQNIWNFWWVGRAIASGQNPFFAPLLYYPQGVQMLVQTLNIVAIGLTLPANWMFGPLAAYNLAAILGVALTGYFGFLLARAFTPGLAGPLLAGALLTACPLHIAKLDSGQLNFVSVQWLVLFMLAMLALVQGAEAGAGNVLSGLGRSIRHQRRIDHHMPVSRMLRPYVAAGAFLLVLFTDWYWAMVAAAFAGVWMLLGLVGAVHRWRLIRRYLLFGLLTGLACVPLVLALLDAGGSGSGGQQSELWAAYTQAYSADALGLFFPAALHPLWSVAAERFLVSVAPYSITEGSYTAAGWVLAVLGLLGAWLYRREHWRLIIAGLVGWVLALGPTLYVLGYNTGLPMPYRLLQMLPLLGTARRPNLFGMITIVVLAIFAALLVERLRERMPSRRFALAFVLIVALAVFELWPPMRVAYALEQPEVFARIAAEPGVVVDLPIESGTDSRTLLHQMVHGQPILRGYVARPPDYPTLPYDLLINRLARMRPWPERDIIALDSPTLMNKQCYYRLRYVVVEKALLTPAQAAVLTDTLTRLLAGPPTPWYEDSRFVAYQLPDADGPCRPFAYLGSGWNDVEQTADRTWRWTSGASDLYVINPGDAPRSLVLDVHAEARAEGQQLTIVAGTTNIQVPLARALRNYRVAIPTTPGLNRLELHTPTLYEESTDRDIGISVQSIEVR